MTRKLAFVTSARSDFGLLLPLIRAAETDGRFAATVLVTGMHLSAGDGASLAEIKAAGLSSPLVMVAADPGDDSPARVGMAMGAAVTGFAQALDRLRPDVLVVLGDRFDMMPAVVAALPLTVPVAHISGGELTEGVIDDCIRHAVTKLSHLHFPAMPEYARRLERLGEETWRIHVTGEPGLDVIARHPYRPREDLFAELGLDPARPLTIFTQHPESIDPAGSADAIARVLAAADRVDSQIVLTYPNSDPGSAAIIAAITAFAAARPHCRLVPSLGRARYLDVLKQADCMVGNSSSGIVEAASFRLPVVNIGERQRGRVAPANVLHVPTDTDAVAEAWARALSPAFRAGLAELANPYGDGHAVERILAVLGGVELGPRLITKKFNDAV